MRLSFNSLFILSQEIAEPIHLDMAKLRINGKRPEDNPGAKVDRAGAKHIKFDSVR